MSLRPTPLPAAHADVPALAWYLAHGLKELGGAGGQKETAAVFGLSPRAYRNWPKLESATRARHIGQRAEHLRSIKDDPGLIALIERWGARATPAPDDVCQLCAAGIAGTAPHFAALTRVARGVDALQARLRAAPDAALAIAIASGGIAEAIGEAGVDARPMYRTAPDTHSARILRPVYDTTLAFLAALDVAYSRLLAPGHELYPLFLYVLPTMVETADGLEMQQIGRRLFDFMAHPCELRRRRLPLTLESLVLATWGSESAAYRKAKLDDLVALRAGRRQLSRQRMRSVERLLYPRMLRTRTAFLPLWFAGAVWKTVLAPAMKSTPRHEWGQLAPVVYCDYLPWWNHFALEERASGLKQDLKPWPAKLRVA